MVRVRLEADFEIHFKAICGMNRLFAVQQIHFKHICGARVEMAKATVHRRLHKVPLATINRWIAALLQIAHRFL